MTETTSSKSDNKRYQAIALQYHDTSELPKIIASGAGEIARRIIEIAEQHDIPIQKDQALTEMLGKLNVGAAISPESYKLVAEIISFLYHTDQAFKALHSDIGKLLQT